MSQTVPPKDATIAKPARIIVFPHSVRASRPRPTLSPDEAIRLRALRCWSSKSRLSRPHDHERACAKICAAVNVSAERYAVGLFRALRDGAERRLVFHETCVTVASTDEMWLLALLRAFDQKDETSVQALLGFRVRRGYWRVVRFFAAGLSDAMRDLF